MKKEKSIICFIPARSGSKSIPNKNIKLLGGKPLIVWSIETALSCGLRTIVNTDSKKYANIAKQYGAEVMMRPTELAQDNTSMFELLQKEIPKINLIPKFVLLLQPTSPFREIADIKKVISIYNENKFDSLILVEQVPEKYNPYAMILETSTGKRMIARKLIGFKEKIISYLMGKKFIGLNLISGYPINQRMVRRQDFPQCWLPTGSMYIFKSENFKKGSIYGKNVILLETKPELNLNTLQDWESAENYLKNLKNGKN